MGQGGEGNPFCGMYRTKRRALRLGSGCAVLGERTNGPDGAVRSVEVGRGGGEDGLETAVLGEKTEIESAGEE